MATTVEALPTDRGTHSVTAPKIRAHLGVTVSKSSWNRYHTAGRLEFAVIKGRRCSSVADFAAMVERETDEARERLGIKPRQPKQTEAEWTGTAKRFQAALGSGRKVEG